MSSVNDEKIKPVKMTIEEYVNSTAMSERNSFAYLKAYSKQKPKTSDEWVKFLSN
jgi:hypothetical protein